MTVQEYKDKLIQAIEDSIEKRWNILAIDPKQLNNVISCPLCCITTRLTSGLCICPIHDNNNFCCKEWSEFRKHLMQDNYEVAKDVADNMIIRLEAINVDEWVTLLVMKGILKW